jgi:hypothetical protein
MPSGWLLASLFFFFAAIGYLVKGHFKPGAAFGCLLVSGSLFVIYQLGGLW